MNELKKALNNLKKCHEQIRNELSKFDDSVIREFLGESYSLESKQDMLKFGDGHVLYSLPRSVDVLNDVDAVVLVQAFSPKLTEGSSFDPFRPLHTIPYWNDTKKLSPQIHSMISGRECRLHFMSWQKNFGIHGTNDAHARWNRSLLLNNNPRFEALFQDEEVASIEFIKHCKDWLDDNGKTMIIITDYISKGVDERISSLTASPNAAIHIEAQIRGRGQQIMRQISDILP